MSRRRWHATRGDGALRRCERARGRVAAPVCGPATCCGRPALPSRLRRGMSLFGSFATRVPAKPRAGIRATTSATGTETPQHSAPTDRATATNGPHPRVRRVFPSLDGRPSDVDGRGRLATAAGAAAATAPRVTPAGPPTGAHERRAGTSPLEHVPLQSTHESRTLSQFQQTATDEPNSSGLGRPGT